MTSLLVAFHRLFVFKNGLNFRVAPLKQFILGLYINFVIGILKQTKSYESFFIASWYAIKM